MPYTRLIVKSQPNLCPYSKALKKGWREGSRDELWFTFVRRLL